MMFDHIKPGSLSVHEYKPRYTLGMWCHTILTGLSVLVVLGLLTWAALAPPYTGPACTRWERSPGPWPSHCVSYK